MLKRTKQVAPGLIPETITMLWEVWGGLDRSTRNFFRSFVYIPLLLLIIKVSGNGTWPITAAITTVWLLITLLRLTMSKKRLVTTLIVAGATNERAAKLMRRVSGLVAFGALIGIYLTVVPVASTEMTRASVTLLALALVGVLTGFTSRTLTGVLLTGMFSLGTIVLLTTWYVDEAPAGDRGVIEIVEDVFDAAPDLAPGFPIRHSFDWSTGEAILPLPDDPNYRTGEISIPAKTTPGEGHAVIGGLDIWVSEEGERRCANPNNPDFPPAGWEILVEHHVLVDYIDGVSRGEISDQSESRHIGEHRGITFTAHGLGCLYISAPYLATG